MTGVRGRKTRKTRVVKLVGKKADKTFRAKGSKSNELTGYCDTSLPLHASYASQGLANKAGMSAKERMQVMKTVPEGKTRPMPPVPPERPTKAKFVSDLEHAQIENYIEKHGLDYIAMSKDKELNPFQHTPKQLRKKVKKVVEMEMKLFPEKYSEFLGKDGKIDLSGNIPESDDEW